MPDQCRLNCKAGPSLIGWGMDEMLGRHQPGHPAVCVELMPALPLLRIDVDTNGYTHWLLSLAPTGTNRAFMMSQQSPTVNDT
jgi:hypothetical protein